jgi:hypothetical protein
VSLPKGHSTVGALTLHVENIIKLLHGPIYYRLLVGHQPLDAAFAKALPRRIFVVALQATP